MSFARKILIPVLTASALITAASIAGEAAASAGTTIAGYGIGSGSTAAAAEVAAKRDLVANYHGCQQPFNLVYDTEGSGGGWDAKMTATCLWAN